ncbi:response regulator transcription factor [Paraburkholderia sp. LEh10]|jgi:two-component system capsular synthesis response regulator RcsB|uniref:response regulator transcription factor n=1 Tax=Paraburkholderia sp. LEh10 TaxID=2821353 RepID=UPI001AE971A2|nr:response regulator transcription factor [Paraburkholderia sp. LEh10]MBP0588927.1 response regulator transcription factor [Paraburkholderia sp. LEh10]
MLADDHPFVLLGIRATLVALGGFAIVGEATSPSSLVQLMEKTPCDVLVTDLTMPNASGDADDGLRLIRRVRMGWPEVRIVVLTSLTNAAILRSIMSDGVIGMLNKSESMDELASAIRAAGAGRSYVSKSILLTLAQASGDPPGMSPMRHLSPRQAEVIRMFVRGKSISEIARDLGRDVRTVSRQKRDAMAKLGVSNDPGLFAFVRAYGLVQKAIQDG